MPTTNVTVTVTFKAIIAQDINTSGLTFGMGGSSSLPYTGQKQTFTLSGTIPTGIDSVTYIYKNKATGEIVSTNEGVTEVGVYEVEARFTVDTIYYNQPESIYGTLTIYGISEDQQARLDSIKEQFAVVTSNKANYTKVSYENLKTQVEDAENCVNPDELTTKLEGLEMVFENLSSVLVDISELNKMFERVETIKNTTNVDEYENWNDVVELVDSYNAEANYTQAQINSLVEDLRRAINSLKEADLEVTFNANMYGNKATMISNNHYRIEVKEGELSAFDYENSVILSRNVKAEDNYLYQGYVNTGKAQDEVYTVTYLVKGNVVLTIDVKVKVADPQLKAYVVKTQNIVNVKDKDTFNSTLKLSCERGTIQGITLNGSAFEGTDLNKDGTYIVTIIPDNDTNSSYTVTFTIDTVVPTVQLNGKTIMGTSTTCKRGGIISLEGGKGTNKFTTALLVKYTSTGEATTETIDITAELKGSGYTVPTTLKAGDYYRVHLLDDKGNLIEFNGGDTLRIR